MKRTEMNQLRSRLNEIGAWTVLVRGASAPPRPAETLTVAPSASASVGPDGRRAPLYVTAEAPSGRTVRRYDGWDADAAADCATELVAERDPRAVWLCGRARIRSWWGENVAALLERRLASVARQADARLVVWTREERAVRPDENCESRLDENGATRTDGNGGLRTHGNRESRTSEDDEDDEGDEDDEAVGDRYDVVLAP